MKKVFVLCLFCACMLLTGCKKEKVLSCSKETDSPLHFTTEMSYHYEDEKLVKLGVKYTYDLSSYNETQRKAFSDAKLCENEAIKNQLGMNDCKEELKGTDYLVYGTAEKLVKAQENLTLETIETSLKADNWTCTLK